MKAPSDPRLSSLFMTDSEVAALIGISPYTFRDWVNNGPPASAPLAIDWRAVERVNIGRFRRWRRAAVANILGIAEADIPNPIVVPRPCAGNRKAKPARSPGEAERGPTRRNNPPGAVPLSRGRIDP